MGPASTPGCFGQAKNKAFYPAMPESATIN